MSSRRRHVGNREDPPESKCLGVFGLSLYTTERELEKEFSRYGPLEKVTVVLDGKVMTHPKTEFGTSLKFILFSDGKIPWFCFRLLRVRGGRQGGQGCHGRPGDRRQEDQGGLLHHQETAHTYTRSIHGKTYLVSLKSTFRFLVL